MISVRSLNTLLTRALKNKKNTLVGVFKTEPEKIY